MRHFLKLIVTSDEAEVWQRSEVKNMRLLRGSHAYVAYNSQNLQPSIAQLEERETVTDISMCGHLQGVASSSQGRRFEPSSRDPFFCFSSSRSRPHV